MASFNHPALIGVGSADGIVTFNCDRDGQKDTCGHCNVAETITPRTMMREERGVEYPDGEEEVGEDDNEVSQAEENKQVIEHISHFPRIWHCLALLFFAICFKVCQLTWTGEFQY